jgi:hypothetical protein
MPIFVFLHVLTMFVAVAMAYGPAMLMLVAQNDIATLRGVMTANDRLQRFVGVAFGIGVVFGIVAIVVHAFNPTAPWLLIAYALFAGTLLITIVFTSPWLKKVTAAAAASPVDAPSPQLRELLQSPRNRALLAVDAGLIVAIIADMVLKPFS